MAASIALAAVALVATASAAFTPDGRVPPVMDGSHPAAVLDAPSDHPCRVLVDPDAPPPGTWAALRPAVPLASTIVFGVERTQVDPLCLVLAFRDGRGWGALITVAEVIWRASMAPPWRDTWDMKTRGAACATI